MKKKTELIYYVFPFRLPSLNEVINKARGNKHASNKLKGETEDMLIWEIKRQGIANLTPPLYFTFE